MKRQPRQPFKPWFKKRRTGGHFSRAKQDDDDLDSKEFDENEIFVGYLIKDENSIDDDDEDQIIKYKVDEACPYQAWNIYFSKKGKTNLKIYFTI